MLSLSQPVNGIPRDIQDSDGSSAEGADGPSGQFVLGVPRSPTRPGLTGALYPEQVVYLDRPRMFVLTSTLGGLGPSRQLRAEIPLNLPLEMLKNGCMWSKKQTFPIWATLQALASTNKALARH